MSLDRWKERLGTLLLVFISTFLSKVASQGTSGYFNQSAVAYLPNIWGIRQHTSLSFRTCSSNGEILYQQGSNGDSLKLMLANGSLELHCDVADVVSSTSIGSNLADNQWYIVDLSHLLGVTHLNVSLGQRTLHSKIISNATHNQQILNINLAGGTRLTVGRTFIGCLSNGPSVQLATVVEFTDVLWGRCPLEGQIGCTDSDKDDCWNNPCENGGVCKDGFQTFQCDCHILYNGTTCRNYIGQLGCAILPCLNNATCIPHTAVGPEVPFVCNCQEGFTGTYCETNLNECLSTERPCFNDGRCIDGINQYTCNCTGTGYEGSRCQNNINECLTTTLCGIGTCFDHPGSVRCDCPPGYNGIPCTEAKACVLAPCLNGGACTNREQGGYQCSCNFGYLGVNCETNIDDCANATCTGENVICQDGLNSYSCICKPGYVGTPPGNCTDFNECSLSPCLNGGQCTNLLNNYSCDCPTGFSGKDCETSFNYCASSPCINGARCVDGLDTFTCMCLEGFTGHNCSVDIDECLEAPTNPCQNGGTCVDQINGNTCDCIPGYTGWTCDMDINECDGQPCQNEANCLNELNRFECDCLPGFTGQLCATNIDDCRISPCQNGGACDDGVNQYSCNCTSAWMGQNCTEQYDACSFTPCKNAGTCSTILGSHDYTCTCVSGYTGSTCYDNIDDCVGITCPQYQVCFDMLNAHRCDCPAGYSGVNCSENIDECSNHPCNNGTCTDGVGNYTCNCGTRTIHVDDHGTQRRFETGMMGRNCEIDINECQARPKICLNVAECKNHVGGFKCYCGNSQGVYYTGDHCELTTDYCQIADVAKTDPPACKNNGTCIAGQGMFTCHCQPGFNGSRCENNIDECEVVRLTERTEPCQYGGTCLDGANGYTCLCIPGITGPNCTVNINECRPDPCENGGLCTDQVNGYECDCRDTGFNGTNCTLNIDDCATNLCQHGATCQDGIKDYNCSCFPGYGGNICEVDYSECAPGPCMNGGNCFERSHERNYPGNPIPGNFSYETAAGFFCRCAPGFNDTDCSNNIDECLLTTTPCDNGGTCLDGVNAFSCSCADGFYGDRCELQINECLVYQACRNGATCLDLVADYSCTCLPSLLGKFYGGKNCSTEMTGCQGNSCQNGASCVPFLADEEAGVHNYTCECTTGWVGRYCNVDTTASFSGTSFIQQSASTMNVSSRLRTTVTEGIINIIGSNSGSFVSLELHSGQVCFLVFRGNGNQPFSSCTSVVVNDGEWHSLVLRRSGNELTFSLKNSRICNALSTCTLTVDTTGLMIGDNLSFGDAGFFPEIRTETLSKKGLVACVQDIEYGDEILVPQQIPVENKVNVTNGCSRKDQCTSTSCRQRGDCVDMWFSYECLCERPYYGADCGDSLTPVTFTPGSQDSLIQFTLDSADKVLLKSRQQFSLFMTSRKPDGLIFFSGANQSISSICPAPDCNFILTKLKSRRICIQFKLCQQAGEMCSPAGWDYSDGRTHFLQIDFHEHGQDSVISNSLKLTIDGTVLAEKQFRKFGALCRIEPDHLYFGSLPNMTTSSAGNGDIQTGRRKRRQTNDRGPSNSAVYTNLTSYKGLIQDARLNDKLLLFFPLPTADSGLPASYPLPSITETVINGIQNADVCASDLCLNNGTCQNVDFNDYNCSCISGFDGKDCALEDLCMMASCPSNGTCNNVDNGYECVVPATFNGESTWINFQQIINSAREINTLSLKLRTRKANGTIVSIRNRQLQRFAVLKLAAGFVVYECNLTAARTKSISSNVALADGEWHSIHVQQLPDSVRLTVDGATIFMHENFVRSLSDLILNTSHSDLDIYVGYDINGVGSPDKYFGGCLDEIRLGEILLPFYLDGELEFPNVNNASERFKMSDEDGGTLTKGCMSQPVCMPNLCQNGANCTDLWNAFRCDCVTGYDGDSCSNNIDDCRQHDCINGATCVDELNAFSCSCPDGFYGYRCEAQINECEDLPCLNGGVCIDDINDFNCNCTSNYTGKICDILITETCDRKPCRNGATCQDFNETMNGLEVARFNCTCAPGYEGKVCDQEINYCEEFPCVNGATCLSNVTLLDYICLCVPGYTGKDCDSDINECAPVPCKNGAMCDNLVNGYNCTCASGWEGLNCDVDIKECNQTINPCGDHGRCVELEGGFRCNCDPGFDGIPCEDINECDLNPPQCKNGANCTNSIGDYSCNCTLGYDGKDCNLGNCNYNQCQMNSTCEIDSENRWKCDCLPFYEGKVCDIIGPCVSMPCENRATCKQDVLYMNYTCICPPGFRGDNCEENINECEENEPCENNATCEDTFGSYNCVCAPGFTGRNCEENIDNCDPDPCVNGECTDLVDGFECDCTDTGYTGLTCSEDINECVEGAPCKNGATCINLDGTFRCDCPESYDGPLCDVLLLPVEEPDIIGPVVGGVAGFLVLIIIICVIVFIVLARNKRATRGTYSPSRQEISGSRVEMGHVLKPPPEERLI